MESENQEKIDPIVVNLKFDEDSENPTDDNFNPTDESKQSKSSPQKSSPNKIIYILIFIITCIPLIGFLIWGSNFFKSNKFHFSVPTLANKVHSKTKLQDNFFSQCKLWVSANKTKALEILRRKECIWAKLWKEVSLMSAADICSVISTVFPTIIKNDSSHRGYFYTLDKFSTFDANFFKDEDTLDWPDESYKRMMPDNWDFGDHHFLMGQKYIQKEIWRRQHPLSCSNVRFCLLQTRQTGLGSAIHSYAMSMGYCLSQANTVFAYVPSESDNWARGQFCGGLNNLSCFFEPLTNCSIPTDPEVLKKRSIVRSRYNGFTMPPFVRQILDKSLVANEFYEWYYTSAASTYIMRLNERTAKWLDDYERSNMVNSKAVYDIGVHVRHGDKFKEMLLIKAKNYLPPIEIFRKISGKQIENINVFLSTEDPDVVNWFVNNSKFSLSYVNYSRNNPHRKQLITAGDSLTLISLANLRISLRTNVRIDTFASNWDRLLIDLMQTYAQRSDALIFEMGVMRALSAEHYNLLKKWGLAERWSYLPKKGAVYEPDDP